MVLRRKSDASPRSYRDPSLVMMEVESSVQQLQPDTWNVGDGDVKVYGGNYMLTNIRIFKQLVDLNKLQNVLAQYTIKESSKLLLIDNATKRYFLPEHQYRSEIAQTR